MKILLLTTFDIVNNELLLKNTKKQYHIFLYFINKYLSEYADTDIIIQQIPYGNKKRHNYDINFPEVDHCILVDNRGFHHRNSNIYELLRSKVKYSISTISANNSIKSHEDILYYLVPSGKRNKMGCKYIGWACSHELCKPKQDDNYITILIDHNYYGKSKRMLNQDLTRSITEHVCEFAKKNNKNINNKKIKVLRFIRGGLEEINLNLSMLKIINIDKYVQGQGLSYEDACEVYSKTDIFFVTHEECMGLVNLEVAMSGGLIVSPNGYIKRELLSQLHHISYDKDKVSSLDMINVLNNINHNYARNKIINKNWQNATYKIYETLLNYNHHKDVNSLYFKNNHKL